MEDFEWRVGDPCLALHPGTLLIDTARVVALHPENPSSAIAQLCLVEFPEGGNGTTCGKPTSQIVVSRELLPVVDFRPSSGRGGDEYRKRVAAWLARDTK